MAKIIQNKPESEENNEEIKIVRECPLCKTDYDLGDMVVLQEGENTHLVHATCPHCQNAILSLVMISPLGLSSVGVMTDLSPDDTLRLKDKKNISDDEVLDFHIFLRKKHEVLIEYLKQTI